MILVRNFFRILQKQCWKNRGYYLDGAPISTPVVREEIPKWSSCYFWQFYSKRSKTISRQTQFGRVASANNLLSNRLSVQPWRQCRAFWSQSGYYWIFDLALFLILWYRLPG